MPGKLKVGRSPGRGGLVGSTYVTLPYYAIAPGSARRNTARSDAARKSATSARSGSDRSANNRPLRRHDFTAFRSTSLAGRKHGD